MALKVRDYKGEVIVNRGRGRGLHEETILIMEALRESLDQDGAHKLLFDPDWNDEDRKKFIINIYRVASKLMNNIGVNTGSDGKGGVVISAHPKEPGNGPGRPVKTAPPTPVTPAFSAPTSARVTKSTRPQKTRRR